MRLKSVGTMPKIAMAHNVVVLKLGTDILFIDARNVFTQVDRAHREFTEPRDGSAGRLTVSAGKSDAPPPDAKLSGRGPWVFVRVEDPRSDAGLALASRLASAGARPAPGDWPMIRRDYSASSFSPLDEINSSNASSLRVAWTFSTGIVAASQQERSQFKNKATALKVLKNKLYQLEVDKQNAAKAALDATKADVTFGSQIRSYVFQPYTMVNDHRTELKIPDVQRVMDGDIDSFVEAYLKQANEGAGR